jgi:hypothetical protein
MAAVRKLIYRRGLRRERKKLVAKNAKFGVEIDRTCFMCMLSVSQQLTNMAMMQIFKHGDDANLQTWR